MCTCEVFRSSYSHRILAPVALSNSKFFIRINFFTLCSDSSEITDLKKTKKAHLYLSVYFSRHKEASRNANVKLIFLFCTSKEEVFYT